MNLPEDILWKIWTFAGPNTYFLDKLLIPFIKQKKQLFIDDPLRIHYKYHLIRWMRSALGCCLQTMTSPSDKLDSSSLKPVMESMEIYVHLNQSRFQK